MPYAAATESRLRTIALSGITIERNATSSSRNAKQRARTRTRAAPSLIMRVEVLRRRGRTADRVLDAGDLAERGRRRSWRRVASACVRDVVGAGAGERDVDAKRRSVGARSSTGIGCIDAGGERRRFRSAIAVRLRADVVGLDRDDGRRRAAGEGVLGSVDAAIRATLGGRRAATAVCRLQRREGERRGAAPSRRRPRRPGGAGRRSRTAPQKRLSPLSCRSRCTNGIAPFSTRSPSFESSAGRTVSEPSTAIATTIIVPIANDMNVLSPVKNRPATATITVRPEMSTERPDVAAAASSAAARCGRRPLFALAADVEQRVVDADREPDQQHDLETESSIGTSWLGRARARRREDRREREHDRQDRGDERAEDEQQDHERDRQREQADLGELLLNFSSSSFSVDADLPRRR